MEKKSAQIIAQKLIQANPQSKAELDAFKRQICTELKIPYPSNIELIYTLKFCGGPTPGSFRGSDPRKIIDLLRVRPVRSLSGIVNVSVLTKPYPCPGNCLYCPNDSRFPKSYLSGEPAAERARLLKFNPYWQTKKRLQNLADEGHNIDKVELRVIGGTWSYYPKNYQNNFISQCFKAGNEFNAKKEKSKGLEKEQKTNETAKCRVVGISIETRPDYINGKEIIQLRKLGVTRVELGIQSIYDDVLKLNNRGHNIDAAINAIKLLKNAGFKVSYQIMLNLYGSTPERDLAMAKELFNNPDFCPDLLKIYPCSVLKQAPLYNYFLQKKYQPYSDEKLIEIVKEIKKITPPWIRIERIIRDIPASEIVCGAKGISNLRQTIGRDMQKENWRCNCIRCREVKENYDNDEKLFLLRRDYDASDGKEFFLSFENQNKTKLFSLLRLRIPGADAKPVFSALKNAAIIREIHTYGLQTAIDQKAISAQHTGLGKKLIQEAERIAKNEFKLKKIASISGVGARNYWHKFGYKLSQTYMVKNLK